MKKITALPLTIFITTCITFYLQPSQRKKQIHIFLPSFIILTFILFCIFPIFLTLLYDFTFTNSGWLMGFLLVLMEQGWVADPLIYIFSSKLFRRKIQHTFTNFKEVTTSRDRVLTQPKYFQSKEFYEESEIQTKHIQWKIWKKELYLTESA